jgi:hypothetical protein
LRRGWTARGRSDYMSGSQRDGICSNMADRDNYAYPRAAHLKDPGLVSVWCTKQRGEQFVRIEAAREMPRR